MAQPINLNPNNPENSSNILPIPETSGRPVDINEDTIQSQNLDAALGREINPNNYGTSNSQIAKPFQSPNFKPGISGWRLNSNGVIEAVDVVLSGTITQSNILTVGRGGTGATTLTGIVKGNGTNAMTTIAPLEGTKVYYVSDSSGGAVNRKLTFQDGILVSET